MSLKASRVKTHQKSLAEFNGIQPILNTFHNTGMMKPNEPINMED